MPVELLATLAPRAPASVRAHETLEATGVRVRESLVPAGAGGASARARQVDRARAREASLRRRFQFALNAQLSQSIFAGNQIHLRYKWLDGRLVGAWPTPRWDWIPSSRQRYGLERLEPLHLPAFEQPQYYPPTPPNKHFTHMDLHNTAVVGGPRAGVSGLGGASGAGSGSSGTSGAVGAGAAVLALAALVLLARALERCLDRRLFKLLRRRSDEWTTPNVLATSHQVREDENMEGEGPILPPGDPPPPYSMCLPKSPQAPGVADPPPPYSACYVAFGGPQDPVPRVYLNGPTLSSFRDTSQPTDLNSHNSVVYETTDTAPNSTIADTEPDTVLDERRSCVDTTVSETIAIV